MKRLIVIPFFAIAFSCASYADAVTLFSYNNISNFSTASNPSGPWSYQSVLIGALPSTATNMVYPDVVGQNSWETTFPTDSYCLIGPSGLMHPGNQTDSLLGFIDPLNYAASVSVVVNSQDDEKNSSSDGKSLSLWLNNTILLTRSLPGDYSGSLIDQTSLTMQPGDKLYLRLNRGSNNINFGDSQFESITVTQTSVPEPAALILFCLGGVGLMAAKRARRRPPVSRARLAACQNLNLRPPAVRRKATLGIGTHDA